MNSLILLDCAQGSDEWKNARLGIPTASQFNRILTAGGKPSEQATAYMAELIAEKITGQPQDGFVSEDMQRGIELEPQARAAYEFESGNAVEQIGGVYLDEHKTVMCSPDGLMPELKKGLEIKCPKLATHIRYILDGQLPAAYKLQVQGALWITGYDTWDFVSYHPDYTPCPTWILTVPRDEKTIALLDKHIRAFAEKLESIK